MLVFHTWDPIISKLRSEMGAQEIGNNTFRREMFENMIIQKKNNDTAIVQRNVETVSLKG